MQPGAFHPVSDADKVLLMSARWHCENAVNHLCRVDDGIFRMTIGAETREWVMQACQRAQDRIEQIYRALAATTLVCQGRE